MGDWEQIRSELWRRWREQGFTDAQCRSMEFRQRLWFVSDGPLLPRPVFLGLVCSDLQWRDDAQREAYAAWEVHDRELRKAPLVVRAAVARREEATLERWYALE